MASSTKTSSMQNPSIVLYKAGDARLEDKPVPTITDPFDVLIRVAYIGVCGSDVHFYHTGGITKPVSPTHGLTVGHEASGTVLSVGASVTRVGPGDVVAIEPCRPCYRCGRCKRGTYNLCARMRFAADPGPPPTPGTLAKYYVVGEDFVYRVGGRVGLQEAVLVEPTGVAVHAVRLVDVRAGETVVVLGSGTVGLLCAKVAGAFGALRVVVVDVLEGKLEFAKGFVEGSETFLVEGGKGTEANAAGLLEMLGGAEVDTVIEASGATASIELGIHVIRPGGKYVQVGMGRTQKIEFPMNMMSEKELMVRGCFRYGAGDFELAVDLMMKGVIDAKPLISSISDFEDATVAWEKTAKGEGVKNLIKGVQD